MQHLREEIVIVCQLEVNESANELYLVLEPSVGGELFDRLVDDQQDYHYTESQCAKLVMQKLCSVVRYFHSNGIIHHDVKFENFLFSTINPDSEMKMVGDFGLSTDRS